MTEAEEAGQRVREKVLALKMEEGPRAKERWPVEAGKGKERT